jgi:hypothetical protein
MPSTSFTVSINAVYERLFDTRKASSLDPVHSVAALIANQAEVTDGGLLNVQGGAWEFQEVHTLPAIVSGSFAVVISLDDDEMDITHHLELVMKDHTGRDLAERVTVLLTGYRRLAPCAIPFEGQVIEEGELILELVDQSGPLANASCELRLIPPLRLVPPLTEGDQ